MEFSPGDIVRCIDPFGVRGLEQDAIYVVMPSKNDGYVSVRMPDGSTEEGYYPHRFQLVERMHMTSAAEEYEDALAAQETFNGV